MCFWGSVLLIGRDGSDLIDRICWELPLRGELMLSQPAEWGLALQIFMMDDGLGVVDKLIIDLKDNQIQKQMAKMGQRWFIVRVWSFSCDIMTR